ncbi:MAG TPA: hypothetical protein VF234_04095, partial [Limnochordia bacterium]
MRAKRRGAGSWALSYQPELVFTFRLICITDQRDEVLVPIWIDAWREEPVEGVAWELLEPVPWAGALRSGIPPYVVARLYRAACRVREAQADAVARERRAAAEARAAPDLARVEAYFDALIDERFAPVRRAWHEAAVAQVRWQLARTPATQALFAEKFA